MRSGPPCALLLSTLLFSACRSHLIDATIENRTGAPVQLLEVDYPSASFGVDSLSAGGDFRYRFQVQGSGQLKISYIAADRQPVQIAGPSLAEHQQGLLLIVLKPGGKAQFLPRLTPPA